MPSIASTYISTIQGIIETIPFDGGTLGSHGLVYPYEKGADVDHVTEVHIYCPSVRTEKLDNVTNWLVHNIVIGVLAKTDNRMQQAQEDVVYLEEQIIQKLVVNFSNAQWRFLDNYKIDPDPRIFQENYWFKGIPIRVFDELLTYQA